MYIHGDTQELHIFARHTHTCTDFAMELPQGCFSCGRKLSRFSRNTVWTGKRRTPTKIGAWTFCMWVCYACVDACWLFICVCVCVCVPCWQNAIRIGDLRDHNIRPAHIKEFSYHQKYFCTKKYLVRSSSLPNIVCMCVCVCVCVTYLTFGYCMD
jgi:hypothetical protein